MRIIDEQPGHQAAIAALLDDAFGGDRRRKTVYRLREGVAPLAPLSVVAEDDEGALRGTLRFWPVFIHDPAGARLPALLLGPIAVVGGLRKTGVGTLLMNEGLSRARRLGHRIVLLVGDEPYYARFGFRRALAEPLTLPGPVEAERFLAAELAEGAMAGVSGCVVSARDAAAGGEACSGAAARPSAQGW